MKYLALFLAVFTLILLTEGCAIPNIGKLITETFVGKSEKPDTEWSQQDPSDLPPWEVKERRKWCKKYSTPTVVQKVRSLLGLGGVIGTVLILVGVLGKVFAGMAVKDMVKCILGGLALMVVSALLDQYLVWILAAGAIIAGLAAVILLRKHRDKIKKWVAWGDEAVSAGHLSPDDIDAVADKTLGPKGSKAREAQKAIMESARA